MTSPKPTRKPVARTSAPAQPAKSARSAKAATSAPKVTRARTTARSAPKSEPTVTAPAVTTPSAPETIDLTADRGWVRNPLAASVGVADLAARTLRSLPETYSSSLATALTTAQAQLKAARGTTRTSVDLAVGTVRALPQTLPIIVRGQLEALPERGEKLVTSVRKAAGAAEKAAGNLVGKLG
jgi:hypothetical protein